MVRAATEITQPCAHASRMVCPFVSFTHCLTYLEEQLAKKTRFWRCLFAPLVSFSQLKAAARARASAGAAAARGGGGGGEGAGPGSAAARGALAREEAGLQLQQPCFGELGPRRARAKGRRGPARGRGASGCRAAKACRRGSQSWLRARGEGPALPRSLLLHSSLASLPALCAPAGGAGCLKLLGGLPRWRASREAAVLALTFPLAASRPRELALLLLASALAGPLALEPKQRLRGAGQGAAEAR